jgi:hypothetical protein
MKVCRADAFVGIVIVLHVVPSAFDLAASKQGLGRTTLQQLMLPWPHCGVCQQRKQRQGLWLGCDQGAHAALACQQRS